MEATKASALGNDQLFHQEAMGELHAAEFKRRLSLVAAKSFSFQVIA
jgi:hypothetical protein